MVADGARARIVCSPAAGGKDEVNELVFETDHKSLREIMSDRPGRSFASHGTRRSAMEYASEPEKEQEERFASLLLEELEHRLSAGEFDQLTIVAEPRMLGNLRHAISPALRRVVVAEFARDLTKTPTSDLSAMLAKLRG